MENAMKSILNNAVMPFVNQGRLSMNAINELIALKEFVDRNATRTYLVGATPESMIARFGVAPDVVTWGDYFQAELAHDASRYSDEEFSKVCDTVKFDIMSACQIFASQKAEFYEWIESSAMEIVESGTDAYSEEEAEIIHLKILKDYYLNLGIVDNFTPEEVLWYNSFSEQIAPESVG